MGDDEKKDDKKPKGSSFLGRWVKRLLVLGVLGAGGLGYAFYARAPGPDGKPQNKYPWEDVEGFKKYSVATFTWAKDEGAKAAATAKAKVESIDWTQWSKEAESLYERAAKVIASGGPADGAAPAAPAAPTAPAKSAIAPQSSPPAKDATPPERESAPAATAGAGYNAYKDAFSAFKDGCAKFQKARPGASTNRKAELEAALKRFDEALAGCDKAESLGYQGAKVDELRNDLVQFKKECRTQLARVK